MACLSLERKAIGWLNFSTLKPAAFTKRPSALSKEASSSRSQMELRPSTCKGEACAPDSWRCFNEKSKSGIYVFDELQLDWKWRKAVPQRRSSRKGFFSPAEDALKRRMT